MPYDANTVVNILVICQPYIILSQAELKTLLFYQTEYSMLDINIQGLIVICCRNLRHVAPPPPLYTHTSIEQTIHISHLKLQNDLLT